jgi:hypothetical protein
MDRLITILAMTAVIIIGAGATLSMVFGDYWLYVRFFGVGVSVASLMVAMMIWESSR